MNHIYKSIFNKALGVFTAVPEFASAHGKGSERTVVGRVAKGTAGFAASALAISVGLALTSTSAVAGPGIYINDGKSDDGCLALPDASGPNVGIYGISNAGGGINVSILAPGQVALSKDYFAMNAMAPCLSSGNAAQALDTQTNRTLFYGNDSYGNGTITNNGAKNLTLGGRLDVNSGIIGVGDRGVNGTGATNSIRMGTGTTLDDANKKENAISIGVNTKATQNWATAIGANAVASGGSASQALGYDAVASGKSAIAHGFHSHADGQSAVAIGDNTKASGIGQVAIGYASNAQRADIDKDATAATNKADYAVTIGHYAGADYTGTNNYRSTLVGDNAGRYGEEGVQNTAVGSLAGMYVKGSNNVALGSNAGSGTATDKLEVSNTTAIGNAAKALTSNSISIGLNSKSGKADAFGGENSIAIGNTAEAMGTSSIAMGKNASTSNGHDSIALGTYATTENQKATVIGSYSSATGVQSLTIANNYDTKNLKPVSTASGTRSTTIGAETNVSGNNSVAIGDTNTVASARTYAIGNNINVKAGADDSLVFGTQANVGAVHSIAMGTTAAATGIGSIALGKSASATEQRAIAMGENALAGNEASMALGYNSSAKGSKQVSIGLGAGALKNATDAGAELATFVGHYAGADNASLTGNAQGVAVGVNAGRYGVAGIRNVAVGSNTGQTVNGNDNTSIGYNSGRSVEGSGNLSGGLNSGVFVKGSNNVALGSNAGNGTAAQALEVNNTTSIGNNAKALTDDSITIGRDSKAGKVDKFDGKKSIAIGYASEAMGSNAIALGSNAATNNGHDSIAMGTYAKTNGEKTISIGAYNTAEGAQSIVIAGNYDASTGSNRSTTTAAAKRAIVVGPESHATAEDAVAIGNKNTVASARTYAMGNNINAAEEANDSIVMGSSAAAYSGNQINIGTKAGADAAQASGTTPAANNKYGIAIGFEAGRYQQGVVGGSAAKNLEAYNTAIGYQSGQYVKGYSNIALGNNAGSGTQDNVLEARYTVSIGDYAKATKNYATAIGQGAQANSVNSVALGLGANVATNAPDSLAFGTKAAVGAENTVAIGKNANAAQANSVALGAGSTTADVHTGDYTLNGSYTAAGLPKAANGTVSVGSAGKERQIQNVAAGVISATSTDAINGSQLYATNSYLSNFAGGVKNVLGGDAAVDNAGNVTMSNIGDTGEGTVHGAIKSVNDKAKTAVQEIESENPTALSVKKDGTKVTLTPNFIAGDLVNADGTVNDPAAADEGKLVSAKTVADALKANHFVVDTKANGGTVDAASEENAKVGSGNKVTFEAGKNLVAQQTNTANGGATVNYKLSDTLENLVSVKSAEIEAGIGPNKVVLNNNGVKVGDSTLNDKGLTINNGPSVTDAGINAGDKKITGVADGNVAAGSKDAVNGGQLAEVKAKADTAVQDIKSGDEKALSVTKAGNTYTITPNLSGDLVDANGNIAAPTTPADKGKLVTAGTVAEALANTHFVVDTKATDGELDAASQADQKIKASNKVTLQAGKNLKAKQTNGANGAEVEFSLKDSISLKEVKVGEGSANEVVLNDKGVNVAGNTYINKDGLNANGNKVANVKAGDVSATSTDAVNGAQLHNVATSVANVLGGNAAVDGNGNVTSSDIGGTGANTVDDAIKAVNATAAKHTTVVEGKNVKVTKGKNAAGGDEYTVATKDDLEVTSVTAGNTTVNTNGLTITGGPSVTRGGIDAGDRVISNVKAGDVSATSKEAVNGSQLYATNTKLDGVKAKADTAVQDVKSGDENALTAVKDPNTNIVTVTPKLSGDLVDADGNITAPTAAADKGKLVTAGTVAQALANTHFVVDTKATDGELDSASQADQKIKAGNKVTLQAGKNLKAKQTNGANGAEVEFSLKDSISLTQVTAGEGSANEVVLNDKGVNVGGNTYINNDGLNANSKVISNVADGVDPTDAVNKGQLDAVKSVADSAVKSVKAKDGEENLVVDNTDPKNPKLSLKKDLTVDSVKAGDSTLNTDGLTIAGGPSVKKDGIDAGDKKITNVAPGAVTPTSKDAVNGSQLYNVANNVKDLIGPDATIDPATGKVTVADPTQGIAGTGKGTIGEAIKSVKDKADTAVQDIKSGDEKALSVTKAGNTYTITPNLSGDLVDADGNITAPATDADKGKLVTAGTVAQALANTHFVVDTKATDGELDGASEADQKIKAGNKVTLQAGKNLKAKQTNGANGAQVEFSLKDSISLKEVTAGEGDNQVVLGNDGVKVGGNTYINKDGLNANSKVISNVADGVKPTDAVNKGQLDAVGKEAAKHTTVKAGKNVEVTEGTNAAGGKEYTVKTADNLDVTSVKAGDSTLNTDGLTIAGGPSVKKDGINAGDKKITNVAPGAVTPTSKDAVNGSQLYNVANNVKDLIGPDATIDPATGKVTVADPAKGIGETGKGNIGDAIKHVNDAAKAAADTAKKHSSVKAGDNIVVTEGTNAAGGKEYTVSTAKDLNVDSVKAGDTTVNNDGVTINNGPSMTKDGINANNTKVTNVADGVDAADAVNKGQLDKVDTKVSNVAQNVVNVLGGDATVNGNGDITMSNIGETGKGNINDAIKSVNDLAKKAAAEKTSVKAKEGRSNVTVTEGTNAAGGHEYTVDVERAVTEAGSDQVTVTSKHDADSNTTTYTVDVSDKTKASLAKADSAVQGLTSKDGNLNFNKDPNGNVEVSFNDNLNVKNVTTDRVQVANGPSMSKDGINAAGKAISNVANGNVAADSKDAVNGGQLYDTAKSVADVIGGGATVKDGKVVAGQNGIGNTGQNTVHGAIAAINQNTANNFNQIRGDLRKMDRDLRGGIAGALATAGLPQAFRPGKSMVAAAASTYRGQSGLAIGVSRISDNGKIILKVTGNTNSRGDFGGTIGAGYQW